MSKQNNTEYIDATLDLSNACKKIVELDHPLIVMQGSRGGHKIKGDKRFLCAHGEQLDLIGLLVSTCKEFEPLKKMIFSYVLQSIFDDITAPMHKNFISKLMVFMDERKGVCKDQVFRIQCKTDKDGKLESSILECSMTPRNLTEGFFRLFETEPDMLTEFKNIITLYDKFQEEIKKNPIKTK